MNSAVDKVKRAVDWKTVASVAIGLAAFGVAVYGVRQSGKHGRQLAQIVTGGNNVPNYH